MEKNENPGSGREKALYIYLSPSRIGGITGCNPWLLEILSWKKKLYYRTVLQICCPTGVMSKEALGARVFHCHMASYCTVLRPDKHRAKNFSSIFFY